MARQARQRLKAVRAQQDKSVNLASPPPSPPSDTAKREFDLIPVESFTRAAEESRDTVVASPSTRAHRRRDGSPGVIIDTHIASPHAVSSLSLSAINTPPCRQVQPSQEAGLSFLHIPKTGGSAIEEAAFNAGVLWGRYYGLHCGLASGPAYGKCNRVAYARCSWHHQPPDKLVGQQHQQPYYAARVRFCVVRDPFERLRSEYIYKMTLSEERRRIVRNCCTSSNPDIRVASYWKAHNQRVTCRELLNGSDFNEWLRVHGQWSSSYEGDCHFVPQTVFVVPQHMELAELTRRYPSLLAFLASNSSTNTSTLTHRGLAAEHFVL